MRANRWNVGVLIATCMTIGSAAAPHAEHAFVIESPATRVSLLELFTSEGCSSCPPAEKWLSAMAADENLWQRIVPVAFHVDYWDYLGWSDPFASPKYSQRQREYAASWPEDRVYTPGFVLDGREWRGYFERVTLPEPSGTPAGSLRIESAGKMAEVRFTPAASAPDGRDKLRVHVAVLGFGIKQYVERGENMGRTLQHDFVVLSYQAEKMKNEGDTFRAIVKLQARAQSRAERYAVAAWVTRGDVGGPLQAVGGWLPAEKLELVKNAGDDMDKIKKTDAEWRTQLTEDQYRVAREKGTERAFTGALLDNKKEGVYLCVACGNSLFASDTKYESGSGWPSFWGPLKREVIKEETDRSHGMLRTEVMCNRCESHLGHLFEDGPQPTGLRYCINSASLAFVPKDEKKGEDKK